MGGKKISTKIKFINKLVTVADYLLLGGGLANTFLVAQGLELGESIADKEELQFVKSELLKSKTHLKKEILRSLAQ